MSGTDRLGQKVRHVGHSLSRGSRVDLLANTIQDQIQQILEPSESRVILLNFPVLVECDPGIDRHGQENSKRRRIESNHRRGAGDVVVGSELGDAIVDGDSHKTDMIRVGKETENVFSVEFIAVECASNIYSTLHLELQKGMGWRSLGGYRLRGA